MALAQMFIIRVEEGARVKECQDLGVVMEVEMLG